MPIQTNDRKCYVVLKLNKTNRDFFKFLTGIEEHSKSAILDNTMSWFQKDLPIDVIDDYHNQFVKIASNEDPSIKVHIPYDKDTDKIEIPIVTDKGVNINQSTIFEGTIVRVQMRYVGIKFYKQQFASEWYATKLIVYDNYDQDDNEDDFDFRDNDDMLSLYSEQPNTNVEVKLNKVEDQTDTANTDADTATDTATDVFEKLASSNVEDIKVNMVNNTDSQKSKTQEPENQEPENQEPENQENQENQKVKESNKSSEMKNQKTQRKKFIRPRRRRVKTSDGSYKIENFK